MATLDNKSIRGNPGATIKYINNPSKNTPPDGLANVSAYIRGEHSVERLYSRGHNGCSCNPELAEQQFRACEALYRQKKGGARESGLTEGKQPIVAEHFFLSFPTDEKVPLETQREIADKLCASPVLRDFYAVSNSHWNTDNDHMHILVCNVSKDGTHKLSMNNTKRNALRKELDRICVSYGLSIIDDAGLRWKDPDREEFVRQAVGKVTVYAPADYRKQLNPKREYDRWMLDQIAAGRVKVADGVSKNYKCDQSLAYKRWVASQEIFIREVDKKSSKKKKAVLVHESDFSKAWREYYWDQAYKSSRHPEHYYAVRRYDDNGYHKPLLVLMFELLFLVATQEEAYFHEKYPASDKNEAVYWGVNKEIQAAYDTFRFQEEQGVRTPAELAGRIQGVGTDLAEARKGYTYYKRAIEKGADLYQAIKVYHMLQTSERTEEEELVFKEAYRIMAAHKCTAPIDIGDFLRRQQFAEKKVKDLDEKINQLRKDYHDLKFIESHTADTREALEYFVHQNADKHGLDDLVNRATMLAGRSSSEEKEKISEKF